VQFKGALQDLNWSKLADLAARPTNWSAVLTDPSTTGRRYYRLVTPQQ